MTTTDNKSIIKAKCEYCNRKIPDWDDGHCVRPHGKPLEDGGYAHFACYNRHIIEAIKTREAEA